MRDQVKAYLNARLLTIYRFLPNPVCFPVKPVDILAMLGSCRCVTYQELAAAGNCGIEDVIRACNSADGCTHYDAAKNRYLVAINTAGRSEGRIRWTQAHELGHIVARHFEDLAKTGGQATPQELACMEEEADYFAANFLAPFQAMKSLCIRSADDIQAWFGLSGIAAAKRWAEYNEPHEYTGLDGYLSLKGVRSIKRESYIKWHYAIDVWADDNCEAI